MEARLLWLQRRRQELVDACRLWVERRWLELVVPCWLSLERSPWWVRKWAAVLEALLEALLLVSRLHRCLESRRLRLLEGSKPSRLRLLEGSKPSRLRHQPVLLEVVPRVLLWEPCHLLLHPLHILHVLHILQALTGSGNLRLHVGTAKACHLRHKSWRRSKGALLGILRRRR